MIDSVSYAVFLFCVAMMALGTGLVVYGLYLSWKEWKEEKADGGKANVRKDDHRQ